MVPLLPSFSVVLCLIALTVLPADSFNAITGNQHTRPSPTSPLSMVYSGPSSHNEMARSQIRSNARSLASLLIGSAVSLNGRSALAVGSGGLSAANEKLSQYGMPPLLFVPSGFTPLVSEFGRGNIKEKMNNPVLVQFCHPGSWVQQKTTVNKNGEAGTVAAGDYMKGDSAFFFSVSNAPLPTDKKGIQALLIKALSQKGDPVDDMLVSKFTDGAPGNGGQKYLNIEYSYKLNTEAGFIIGRKGCASMTSVGPNVQMLLVAVTDKRYKKLEEDVKSIANSFRVYRLNSGLFSAEG